MQASSVLVMVLLCGGALAQNRVIKLDPAIENPCKELTHLSDGDVHTIKELKFDDLTLDQKEFMHCYMKKGKMVNDASDIIVENIKYSTPERVRACADKLGNKLLSSTHVVAFALCIQEKKLNICEIAKKYE